MRDSREYSRKEAACERNPYYGEYRGRQIPRRMRENERGAFHGRGTFPGKKRRMMGFVIVCLLLAMNIFLLLELGERVRGLDTELDEVMGRMSMGGQERDISVPETGTKEEMPNRTYE